MLANRLEPLVADPLAVDAGHVVTSTAHDVIDGNLISTLTGHCLEGVPQRVRSSVPADAALAPLVALP